MIKQMKFCQNVFDQFGLETSKKVSDFIFDYKCHKINFKRDQLYIDFPD